MPINTLNQAEIFWEEKGDGIPVLFLNGVMMTTASWAQQTRVMRKHVRCIMHDTRGQLRSGKQGPYTMEQHAEDVIALMDHLALQDAHIVGTSYGGEIGLIVAHRYPKRVRSLSVIASVAHSEEPLRTQVNQWIDASHNVDDLFARMLPDNYAPAFREREADQLAANMERIKAFPKDFFPAFRDLCRAFLDLDIRALLPEIQTPTLIVCAELDLLKKPQYSREMAAALPNSEFLMIPEAGHAVVLERPETLNSALLGFIFKHEEAGHNRRADDIEVLL